MRNQPVMANSAENAAENRLGGALNGINIAIAAFGRTAGVAVARLE
jgi:hypothetical protein